MKYVKKTITTQQALVYKPKDLGTIELELLASPPRKTQWFDIFKNPIEDEQATCLNYWLALRGWITHVDVIEDSEGPNFHIYYAFEREGDIHNHYYTVGYDGLHWAISYADHHRWFYETMKPGKPLTILVHPQKTNLSEILGQFEVFNFSSGDGVLIAN